MKLLLSNDDGVEAPGLQALAAELEQIAEVVVVAPDRDRSGASNSLTLDRSLHPRNLPNGFVALSGTPTDCVFLGLNGLFPDQPQRVVSGINAGANLGDDVLYSGTVAAAMEGRALGAPSLAVSLARLAEEPLEHYATAAAVVRRMLTQDEPLVLAPRTVININVPNLPLDEIEGVRLTRLGHRGRAQQPMKVTDPRGNPGFWIGGTGEPEDGGPGTDFDAIREHCVSVTPLQVDMTRHESFDLLSDWLIQLW